MQKYKIILLSTLYSLLSTILIGCAGQSEKSFQAREDQDTDIEEAADEMLSSFSVSGYAKGGQKQWDLEGKSADIMTEEIKLIDVTGKVYGKKADMTIVADEGSLNRVDNNVHLEKNVQASSDDGATLNCDYLDWDAQNQKLSSESAVHIERGLMEAFGSGMLAQPALNLIELKKDVTVKFLRPRELPQAEGAAIVEEAADSAATVITCIGPLKVDYQNNLAIFKDKVRVEDQRGEILANRMDIHFAPQTEKNKQMEGMEGMWIEQVVAEGFVEIHRGSNISYSQKAVYDTDTGKLTLTGQPKLVIYSTEDFAQLMQGEQ